MPNTSAAFAFDQTDYIDQLNQLVADVNRLVSASGLTAALDAGGFKVTHLANATAPGDAVNLETANALLVAGGTPSAIGVTSFAVGELNDQEALYRDGAALVGLPAVPPAIAMHNWTNFGGF